MATIITAPEEINIIGFKVFLAGAIDMGSAVDWQSYVIDALKECEIILLNPRRPNFTPDTLDAQIRWELDAMDKAYVVFMWFPQAAKAPISLLETGLWMDRKKLLIGVEHGFYRRRNLELTCEHYGVRLWDNLDAMIQEIRN